MKDQEQRKRWPERLRELADTEPGRVIGALLLIVLVLWIALLLNTSLPGNPDGPVRVPATIIGSLLTVMLVVAIVRDGWTATMVRIFGTLVLPLRIAGAVWNGPFHIGKLSRPVSLGDAVMKVLETAWRGGVLVVTAGALIGAASAAQNVLPREKALAEQIVGNASLGNPACDAAYPLHVSLKNNSKQRVGKLVFYVAAYEPGHSTNLADRVDFVSDTIIPAGKTFHACWEGPPLTEQRQLRGLRFVVAITEAEPTSL